MPKIEDQVHGNLFLVGFMYNQSCHLFIGLFRTRYVEIKTQKNAKNRNKVQHTNFNTLLLIYLFDFYGAEYAYHFLFFYEQQLLQNLVMLLCIQIQPFC